MTAGTTVIGLLPMTGWFDGIPWIGAGLGAGAGAEMRAPMAITVIAGLTCSTLLTLVVIPVVYYLVARLSPRSLGDQERGMSAAPHSGPHSGPRSAGSTPG